MYSVVRHGAASAATRHTAHHRLNCISGTKTVYLVVEGFQIQIQIVYSRQSALGGFSLTLRQEIK